MQSAHGQGRGQQRADKQQPEPGVYPQMADQSVGEEASSEHTEGASKHWGAESPESNVKLGIVELEKVSGVVSPAVAGSVAEEGFKK